MRQQARYTFGLILLFLGACSSQRNTFTNRAFHNLTSHYNAYFLADTKIKEAERQVLENYKEDYTQILPVFIPIDSATIQKNKIALDSARELSSKAIDWHRISKWVDDSYYLLGKIDYLQARTEEAKNAFRFVNSQSKDIDLRHKALISLLRLYIDLGALEDANFTIDYLSKEGNISPANRFELYKTLAYYYESKSDQNGVIGALDKALSYTTTKKEESRIFFILAQRYQREGLSALAFDYFQKSLVGNPSYEQAFFATLYAQQVAELNASKDLKKVRNYYEDLYKDPKNKDLKDVVIFERALFEEKQNDIPLTLDLLHQAAKETGSIPRVKGYIYQKLADLKLNQFKDYRATKYYLDSALTYIKAEDPVAKQLEEQKASLDTYVFHFERIQKQDSLIQLASLPLDEQVLQAEKYIDSEKKRAAELKSQSESAKSTSIFDNLLAFGEKGTSTSTFYFDNSLALQQGALEFVRTWGNRPLQDNWRRKAALTQAANQVANPTTPGGPLDTNSSSDSTYFPSVESLLASIPKSPEQLKKANSELEESYFELGKVLYIQLKEPQRSQDYLEQLVQKYPNTLKKPETYYLLYLGEKELNGDFNQYIQLLNQEFPESPYTFSVNNPEAGVGNQASLASAKGYEQAYEAYYSGKYRVARELIFSTLENYPLTRNTDKLVLLNAMVSGKLESREQFKTKLEEFIQVAKDSELIVLAEAMLRPLLSEEELRPKEKVTQTSKEISISEEEGERKIEETAAKESPYKATNDQTHIIILALSPAEVESAKNLLGDLEAFHSQTFGNARLRTGNMNISAQQSLFIISPFSNSEKAMTYLNSFQEKFTTLGLAEETKTKAFFISIENFQVLNKTKDLEEYLQFFSTTYR
ncbi:MAG: gliding motility protein [Algoriphagus sp.]|nr:gliding motility protein [Algoriphagus sp.]MDP4904183.1 gliding motility protein [Algoriphagus sp.]MDP4957762.1 gliding motility protein [Algoriphagus sp.]